MTKGVCKLCLVYVVALALGGIAHAQVTFYSDLHYDAIPGVDPNLLALDIYVPAGANGTNPVMMMFHGGSYIDGDKTVFGVVHPKMEYYTGRGWIFLSVNYRLTNIGLPSGHPDQVTHPDHVQDVARSIAWTIENISAYGGDPGKIVLMGFSAGAHLVALVASDESRLAAEGYALNNLDGVIALDGLYDVPLRYRQFPPPPPYNVLIWGSDPATQQDMSASLHVEPGKCIPPMLVVHQNIPNNIEQSTSFVSLLAAAGYSADSFNAVGLSHTQIGGSIGIVGHPMTILVDGFLASLPMNSGGSPSSGSVAGLTVNRSSEELLLRWGPSCVCTDSDYVLYEGSLGDFTSHLPVTCSTQESVEHRHFPMVGSRYFLVAPRSANSEGSLGTDSQGTAREQGPGACMGRDASPCVPCGPPVCP